MTNADLVSGIVVVAGSAAIGLLAFAFWIAGLQKFVHAELEEINKELDRMQALLDRVSVRAFKKPSPPKKRRETRRKKV